MVTKQGTRIHFVPLKSISMIITIRALILKNAVMVDAKSEEIDEKIDVANILDVEKVKMMIGIKGSIMPYLPSCLFALVHTCIFHPRVYHLLLHV